MTVESLLKEGHTVLVTGATGFIGAHCVGQLLQKNVQVKALCRSPKKYKALKLSVPPERRELLSMCIAEDISNYESLVAAVKGCDFILHLASPYTYNVTDHVKELLEPALNGTTAIMRAALTESRIKRVVLTSSIAAILDASKGLQPGVVVTENDFCPLTWEDGATTSDPAVAYRASKIVAERAAWDFMQKNKPKFDLTVICPPMVFGPLYSTKMINSLEEMNFSNTVIMNILKSSSSSNPVPPTKGPVWVDVRDLAFAHVQALIKQDVSGQRFLVSKGDFDNQEIADILRDRLDEAISSKIPVGNPGERLAGTHFTTDSRKAIKCLDISFTNLEKTVLDFADQVVNYKS